ncbi:MAG: tyrosine-type recombinase/integrase [bacterium]|nr:tyrosine-type recombinase/integrase [bacterium]
MDEFDSPYISQKFSRIFQDYSARFEKKRTRKEYVYVLNSLCNEVECDFLDLNFAKIQTYFSHHKMDLDSKTLKYQLRIFQAVARFLDEHASDYDLTPHFLSCFLMLDFEDPDVFIVPETLPDFASIDKVFAYLKANRDTSVFLAATLALRCSLTINEVVSLKKEMFFQDLNGSYGLRMKVSQVNDRFVKLPQDVVDIIQVHLANRTQDSVFLLLNKHGRPLSIRSLQNRLRDACLACDVKPFTMNHLRTLSTAFMMKEGAPPDKIAEYINIKNQDWFFRYDRVVEELKDSAVDYTHLKIVW